MDHGDNTHLRAGDPPKRPSAGVVGVDVPAQQSDRNKPVKAACAPGVVACEIKHPLTAILANASAARRWLNGPDVDTAEAMMALDRIASDVARIDAALEALRAMPAEQVGQVSLP